MTRTMMGRTTVAGGALAALALLVGCSDAAEFAEVCATRSDTPVRVDEQACAAPLNRAQVDGFGWYEIQLPAAEYDYEGNGWYPDLVIVDVGSPLPRAGTPGSGVFRRGVPAVGAPPAIRPPAKASGPSGLTSVSRGGLGTSSVGSSGS